MTSEPDNTPNAFRFFIRCVTNHPLKIGGIFVGDFFQAVFLLMIPFAVRDLINALDGYDGNGGPDFWVAIHDPLIWFFSVFVLMALAARTSGILLFFLAPVIRLKPRAAIFDHLKGHSYAFFQNSHGGALGNKMNEAMTGMAHALWTFAFDMWPVLIKFSTSAVLIFITNTTMGLGMTAWIVVYAGVILTLGFHQSRVMSQVSGERSKITGQMVDVVSNIHAVKSFARENYEQERLIDTMDGERRKTIKFNFIREGAGMFDNVMGFTLLTSLMMISLSLYAKGTFTIGDIAFVFSLNLIIIEQSRALLWGTTHFLEYLGQMRDGVDTIMVTQDVTDKTDAPALIVATPRIDFTDVGFFYPENPDKLIFDHFNLNVEQMQKIGLVGPSGAGKSTLVNLLLRFYDLQNGTISIDGQNIANVTQTSVREHIAAIPQDTALFHRTLMDNIRYGRVDASDEEVIAAAKDAQAHDFIAALPHGYDTMVGERGVKLSGGQRQRIAIARAILKDAPILILDEATSALDSESEQAIQTSLTTLMEGRTVIVIAHRLSTIAHLDRLVVIQDGGIVEDGTHTDLVNNEGLYAKLWAMQSGGFLPENL